MEVKIAVIQTQIMMFDSKQFSEIKHEQTNFEPSLNGGYSALYDNRIPMDIRYIDYDRNVKQIGGAEIATVKIFTFGSKSNISKIKLEIDSEYDPFFDLIFECDLKKYEYIKQQQSLTGDFQDFPTLIIKCFNKIEEQFCCKNATGNYKGKLSVCLLVSSDGKAKMTIDQSSEYKNVQVLALDLSPQNQQNIEEKASYKYGELKKKVAQNQERLRKIEELIKLKNPTLLTQIYKTTGLHNSKLNMSGI